MVHDSESAECKAVVGRVDHRGTVQRWHITASELRHCILWSALHNVPLTCDATIGATSGPVGSAAFAASLVEITMVASDGTTVMSQPSALSTDETGFRDTWGSAGH